ncbi:hypothetical protein KBB96_09425 [Luteolibacter ambystomatis]|uniref:EF-hand domain-containing protein n=1 Tax=Luteolibacter ambystomatis TaxID=2824561 RepID=A0A975J313_9BACT|nr:choice-of-anchor tandem repeat GloVer-containing protein [Luteolibacter ambystomatis]QUE53099.1 hypothetical protein KBB96_09425 [Luteolibacter ambystomatis]
MKSPIFRRICRAAFVSSLAWAVSGAAMAATTPPVLERVQALPLSPKDVRMKLVEIGGEFYGTSPLGGAYDLGTFYKLTKTGTLTVLVNFNGTNGAAPKGELTLGTNGELYGTTESGGANGKGTVFRVSTAGVLTTLASFSGGVNGSAPNGGVTLASDGNFYGNTSTGGTANRGTIFQLTPGGTLTTIASFDSTKGSTNPTGRMVADANGLLYGVCTGSDAFMDDYGSIYTVTTTGTLNLLVKFNVGNGMKPKSGLIPDGAGNFLGTTWEGGQSGIGCVYRLTPAGAITVLGSFDGSNGRGPACELTLGEDGNYYGTSYRDGSGGLINGGTIFRVAPAGGITRMATFGTAGPGNGGNPMGGVVLASDGLFYGITSNGGHPPGDNYSTNGVFFRMDLAGNLTTLATFTDFAGKTPMAGLVLASDGNFYGSASEGGGYGYGAFFRMTPQGVLSTVASCGYYPGTPSFGAFPKAALTASSSPIIPFLFSTTTYGPFSAGSNGSVVKINPATNAVTLDGALNVGATFAIGAQTVGPVVALSSTSYGMTSMGGSGGLGTFYRSSGGTITTLANFSSSTGNTPLGGPTSVGGTTFYASNSAGGTGGKGTIFKINGTSGTLETLVNFDGTNGGTPVGELLLQGNILTGTFYGVTRTGGTADKGTVFKMTPAGALTTLASFTGANGSTPQAGLAFGADGNFYGTTEKGGTYDLGTLYRITPEGVLTTVVSFDGTNGSYPWSRLISAPGGYLYGTTSSGGLSADGQSGGGGQIFRLRVYPDVLTGIADPVSFNSALLHGTATPIEQSAVVSFEYGTDSTLATSTALAANIPGGSGNGFMGVASPLAPLTTYYYRALTTLADGVTKVRGDIQSFTTLAAPPDIAVDAGGQTNLASDGAALVLANTAVGQTRDFEITVRTSVATSTLSGLSASITEQDSPFTIVQQPAASVAFGSTTTLVVRFSPVALGGSTATITIASDDADENPFTLHLRAWGGDMLSPVIDPANPAPVEWDGFIATGITLSGTTLTAPPHRGTEYVLVSNPGSAAVEGTFNGLPEGSLVTIAYGGNNYRFLLSYQGGDGNDIVLSYWPETGIDPSDSPEAFLFAALDSNRDDKLARAEWLGIYAKLPKKETIFDVIDSNRDGFLTLAEFTAGATNRTASRTISTAVNRTAVFMEVDTSYDNIVSRAEIAFMWKPGTAAKTIDAYWTRAQGGDGMDFWDWLWAQTLPSFTTYDQAGTMRVQRRGVAGQLDADTSGTITFAEFSHLYKAGTKTATIDTAWRAANATPRGTASPASMTIDAFVEAPKLPKLMVF